MARQGLFLFKKKLQKTTPPKAKKLETKEKNTKIYKLFKTSMTLKS